MTTPFKADYSDQTAIFDPTKFGHKVTVIGCGGIGASTLLTLATLGIPHFDLWDPDIVEPRNVASQLMFRPCDVTRPKVVVAQETLLSYGVPEVTIHEGEFHADEHADELDGIVISGVDTMAVRKDIWQAIAWNPSVALYLDGRIGGEHWQLNSVDPNGLDDIEWYEQFQLFDDADAAPLPCAERAVVYPAVMLGAAMVANITRFQRGLPLEQMLMGDMKTMTLAKMG